MYVKQVGLPGNNEIEHLVLYGVDIGDAHHVGACMTDDNDVSVYF